VRILFFGRLGGCPPAGPVPPEVRDSDALRTWLGEDRPELLDPSIRIAVNDEMILGKCALDDGDEIAFLPPMSGG